MFGRRQGHSEERKEKGKMEKKRIKNFRKNFLFGKQYLWGDRGRGGENMAGRQVQYLPLTREESPAFAETRVILSLSLETLPTQPESTKLSPPS